MEPYFFTTKRTKVSKVAKFFVLEKFFREFRGLRGSILLFSGSPLTPPSPRWGEGAFFSDYEPNEVYSLSLMDYPRAINVVRGIF